MSLSLSRILTTNKITVKRIYAEYLSIVATWPRPNDDNTIIAYDSWIDHYIL